VLRDGVLPYPIDGSERGIIKEIPFCEIWGQAPLTKRRLANLELRARLPDDEHAVCVCGTRSRVAAAGEEQPTCDFNFNVNSVADADESEGAEEGSDRELEIACPRPT
jgi:hypothetical protein